MAPVKAEFRKYTTSLTDEDIANLHIIQEHTGLNGTDAIRLALSTQAQMHRWLAKGYVPLVRTRWDRLRQIVFRY